MKLFEIPVYAFSKETLEEKVENARQKLLSSYEGSNVTNEHINTAFFIKYYPHFLWEYNHIVGYIVISKKANDIVLEWYTSSPSIIRYHWDSNRKHFLKAEVLSGYHFYIGNLKTGDRLRERIHDLLKGFINDLKKSYFVDIETFNNIDSLLNYDKLLKSNS